jgi:hypothetical protein
MSASPAKPYRNRPASGPDRRVEFKWFWLAASILAFLGALTISGWLPDTLAFGLLLFLAFAVPAWAFALIAALIQRARGKA